MHACSFGFKVLNFEKLKKLVFLISQLCGIEGMLKKKFWCIHILKIGRFMKAAPNIFVDAFIFLFDEEYIIQFTCI